MLRCRCLPFRFPNVRNRLAVRRVANIAFRLYRAGRRAAAVRRVIDSFAAFRAYFPMARGVFVP